MIVRAQLLGSKETGFHHSRLAKQITPAKLPGLPVEIRPAKSSEDLWQAALLRAAAFYVYPPERAFAGKLHQAVKAKEEFAALSERDSQKHACLLAIATLPILHGNTAEAEGNELRAVGTLDLVLQTTLEGEVLRGRTQRPAYLANFCVADAARRRGVASAMLTAARQLAHSWDVDGLFVHMMAANAGARAFYENHGFVLDQEESSNRAHYRGRCLDGVTGGARTVLLRDLLPTG